MPDPYGFDPNFGLSPAMGRYITHGLNQPDPYGLEEPPIPVQEEQVQSQLPTPVQQPQNLRELPPPPSEIGIPTWPEYLKANQNADPNTDAAKVYEDYVTKLMPDDLKKRRFTYKEIAKVQDEFRRDYPAPQPKPKVEEPSVTGVVKHKLQQQGLAIEAAAPGANLPDILKRHLDLGEVPIISKFGKTWDDLGGATNPLGALKLVFVDDPLGAWYTAINTLTGFAPLVTGAAAGAAAGSLALPGIGTLSGGAIGGAVGGSAAIGAEQFGNELLNLVASEAQKANIDPRDTNAVAKFLADGGIPELNLKALKPAAANAAISLVTMLLSGGLLGRAGATAKELLTGQTAAKVESTLVPEVAKKSIRNDLLAAGGVNVAGFTAAPIAGEAAAGRPITPQLVLDTALGQALFAATGVPSHLKYAPKIAGIGERRIATEKKAAEILAGKPGEKTTEEHEAALDAIVRGEEPPEGGVPPTEESQPKVKPRIKLKVKPAETVEEEKQQQIDTLDDTVALIVAFEEAKEVKDANLETAKATLNAEAEAEAAAKAKAEPPATTETEGAGVSRVPPVAEQPTAGGGASAVPEIPPVQQGPSGEVTGHPVVGTSDSGGAKGTRKRGKGLSRSGEQTGDTGGTGAGVVAGPELQGRDTTGAEGTGAGTGQVKPDSFYVDWVQKFYEEKGQPITVEQATDALNKNPELFKQQIDELIARKEQEHAVEKEKVMGLKRRVVTKDTITKETGNRLKALNRKKKLTPAEQLERELLNNNKDDPEALAALSGAQLEAEPKPGRESDEVISQKIQAGLDHLIAADAEGRITKKTKNYLAKALRLRKEGADLADVHEAVQVAIDSLTPKSESSASMLFRPFDIPEGPMTGHTTALFEAQDTQGLLDHLIKTTPSSIAREMLRQLKALGLKIEFKLADALYDGDGKPALGKVTPLLDGSFLLEMDRTRGSNETLTHEFIHTGTLRSYRRPLTERQRKAVAEINRLYEQAKQYFHKDEYGMTNAEEFVAEGHTREHIQTELKKHDYEGKNLWERIAQAFLKLFGLQDTVMSRLEKSTRELLEGPRAEKRTSEGFIEAAMAAPEPSVEEAPIVLPKRGSFYGWKEGKPKFGAIALSEQGTRTGEYRIVTSEDLYDSTKPKTTIVVKDLQKVYDEFNKGDYSRTKREDDARELMKELSKRPEFKFIPPSRLALIFADRELAVKYLGEHAQYEAEKRNIPLPESQNPTLINTRKISLIANEKEELHNNRFKPLEETGRKLLKDHNRTKEQFDRDWIELMYDSGIGELLNANVYATTPNLKARVMVKQAEAKAYLATLPDAYRADLLSYAKELKALHNELYDYLAKDGHLTRADAQEYKDRHELYIPFRGDEKSSKYYRAIGIEAPPKDPLSRLVNEWHTAIRDNYENQETVAVRNLAMAWNPKLKDGTQMFDLAPVLGYKYDKYGEIQGAADPLIMRQHSDSTTAWIEGIPYRMAINEPSVRAGLQRVPAGEMKLATNTTMQAMAMFNAVNGALKTAFSPVFGLKNHIRDTAAAFAQANPNISRTQLLESMLNPINWRMAIREAADPWYKQKANIEVKEQGGYISRRGQYGMFVERKDPTINLKPTRMQQLGEKREKYFGFESGTVTSGLSFMTKVSENVTRTALYDASMKSPKMQEMVGKANGTTGAAVESALHKVRNGQTITAEERTLVSHLRAEASKAAKISTTNFEPKGQISSLTNALYMFANAKTQGLRTTMEQLGLTNIKGGETFGERIARGNRITQGTAAATMLGGMTLAMYGYNKDPENFGRLEDYQKDDYATWKSGGFSTPLMQELAFFNTVGQAFVDAIMNTHRYPDDSMRLWKASSRVGTRLLQMVWPGSTSLTDPVGPKQGTFAKFGVRMAMPTIAQPLLDLAMKETTFGSPPVTGLHEGRPPKGPTFLHNAGKVSPLSRGTAEVLHAIGIESYPQTTEHIINSFIKPQIDLMWMLPEGYQFMNSVFGEPKKTPEGLPRPNPFARTFFQEASPYSYKSDVENFLAYETDRMNSLKEKPSKKIQILQQGSQQAKNLLAGYQTKSEEQKIKVNAQVENVFKNTLKKYREQFTP